MRQYNHGRGGRPYLACRGCLSDHLNVPTLLILGLDWFPRSTLQIPLGMFPCSRYSRRDMDRPLRWWRWPLTTSQSPHGDGRQSQPPPRCIRVSAATVWLSGEAPKWRTRVGLIGAAAKTLTVLSWQLLLNCYLSYSGVEITGPSQVRSPTPQFNPESRETPAMPHVLTVPNTAPKALTQGNCLCWYNRPPSLLSAISFWHCCGV